MTEAKLAQAEGGWLEPEADGWYVLNAHDAKWLTNEMGGYCSFEGQERFPEFGLNLNRLPPGVPMAMYHHVKRWDFVHCPRDVPHVIVGAGDGALVLAVGSRVGPSGVGYPVDETALKHGAGVEIATNEQSEAYAKFGKLEASTGPDGLLP